MNVRPLLSALLVTGVSLLGMAHGGSLLLQPAAAPPPALRVAGPNLSAPAAALQNSAQASLDRLAARDPVSDPRYYQAGVWVHEEPLCFRCDVGPGVTAAVLAALTGNVADRTMAIDTMDTAIRLHRLPSGAFGPPAGSETTPDIQTTFYAVQLGITLQVLGATLDAAHRTAWGQALGGAADFLDKNGNYKWYTNGNVVIANAVTAAMAWRATGNARYQAMYNAAYTFALSPPQNRWPGRGLVMAGPVNITDPTRASAYLTEEGPGTPGFDADYGEFQADLAAILFLVTGESRVLDLTNMLVNQLLPRVNKTTWDLDTSGGTRRPTVDRVVPFTTCALAVLASNGRTDLIPLAQSQSKAIASAYAGSTTYTNIGIYQQWGTRLAPTLLTLH
jgi:hypothetical protein